MWELLLALDLVPRHMQRTFEPDSLVKPIGRVRSERDDAVGASAPAARPPRVRTLALRRHAA
jgi:hypothetical protein